MGTSEFTGNLPLLVSRVYLDRLLVSGPTASRVGKPKRRSLGPREAFSAIRWTQATGFAMMKRGRRRRPSLQPVSLALHLCLQCDICMFGACPESLWVFVSFADALKLTKQTYESFEIGETDSGMNQGIAEVRDSCFDWTVVLLTLSNVCCNVAGHDSGTLFRLESRCASGPRHGGRRRKCRATPIY